MTILGFWRNSNKHKESDFAEKIQDVSIRIHRGISLVFPISIPKFLKVVKQKRQQQVLSCCKVFQKFQMWNIRSSSNVSNVPNVLVYWVEMFLMFLTFNLMPNKCSKVDFSEIPSCSCFHFGTFLLRFGGHMLFRQLSM